MSSNSFITRPIRNLTGAVVMPFKALFVVALCGAINALTYSGTWWVKWVALGMGIAVLVALARAAKTLLLLAVVAWVGLKIYKRHGPAARENFDAWVAQHQPQMADVLQSLRSFRRGSAA